MRPIALLLFSCTTAFADTSVTSPQQTNKTARAEAGCEKLPASWKLDEMVTIAGARYGVKSAQAARVLAWKIEEDDRPLRIDAVLLWLRVDKRWGLANLYRHPLDGPNAPWHVSMVYDVPYVGEQTFDHAPNRSDLEGFLTDTWWNWEGRSGFKLLDGEVCPEAWKTAFGAAPWHHYTKK